MCLKKLFKCVSLKANHKLDIVSMKINLCYLCEYCNNYVDDMYGVNKVYIINIIFVSN